MDCRGVEGAIMEEGKMKRVKRYERTHMFRVLKAKTTAKKPEEMLYP